MLGTALMQACAQAGAQAIGMDLPELDITRYDRLLERMPVCDAVVNCAAYTNVDQAEVERDLALAVNAKGAGNLARACASRRTRLLHVSTDYVFDGTAGRPYLEDDPTNPVGYYGVTKLEGEKAVLAATDRCIVMRTQSLFGLNGRNFVLAILRRLDAGQELRVVSDQTSSPTHVAHLSAAILRLLAAGRFGIVHASAGGSCSWHEFACAIVARVRPETAVAPVKTGEFKTLARRPAYSVLDKSRLAAWTGFQIPTWQEGLDRYLKEIGRLA